MIVYVYITVSWSFFYPPPPRVVFLNIFFWLPLHEILIPQTLTLYISLCTICRSWKRYHPHWEFMIYMYMCRHVCVTLLHERVRMPKQMSLTHSQWKVLLSKGMNIPIFHPSTRKIEAVNRGEKKTVSRALSQKKINWIVMDIFHPRYKNAWWTIHHSIHKTLL